MPAFDVAVVLAAFEPYLLIHRQALRHALGAAPRVLVLLGSARSARSLRHPWTAAERSSMIRADLSPADNARVEIRFVNDRLYSEPAWLRELQNALHEGELQGRRVLQVLRSGQQPSMVGWHAEAAMQDEPMDLIALRRAIFGVSSSPAPELAQVAPPDTLKLLASWQSEPWFDTLQREYRYIEAFRKSWQAAPYPPLFVTTDAVVLLHGHLLLIQRAREPGKSMWALPGGFVEPDESLLTSCLRELREETGLDLSAEMTCAHRPAARVFDAPHRSLRGRTITHAFRLDLQSGKLLSITAGDDAGSAAWIPLSRFHEMETEMFEDHFHIATRMLAAD